MKVGSFFTGLAFFIGGTSTVSFSVSASTYTISPTTTTAMDGDWSSVTVTLYRNGTLYNGPLNVSFSGPIITDPFSVNVSNGVTIISFLPNQPGNGSIILNYANGTATIAVRITSRPPIGDGDN